MATSRLFVEKTCNQYSAWRVYVPEGSRRRIVVKKHMIALVAATLAIPSVGYAAPQFNAQTAHASVTESSAFDSRRDRATPAYGVVTMAGPIAAVRMARLVC
jgi:hypothetical protein